MPISGRRFRARSLVAFCAVAAGVPACPPAGSSMSGVRPQVGEYTIAFASFAPNSSDSCIADRDGSHARPLVLHAAADYDASPPRRAMGRVHVASQDTGRRVPVADFARIFEPFVQIDRHVTQASQQGVGLGLAISRELARGMKGDLTVASEVGRGSTFTLTLPRAPTEM